MGRRTKVKEADGFLKKKTEKIHRKKAEVITSGRWQSPREYQQRVKLEVKRNFYKNNTQTKQKYL